jgi:hypothetical protein
MNYTIEDRYVKVNLDASVDEQYIQVYKFIGGKHRLYKTYVPYDGTWHNPDHNGILFDDSGDCIEITKEQAFLEMV